MNEKQGQLVNAQSIIGTPTVGSRDINMYLLVSWLLIKCYGWANHKRDLAGSPPRLVEINSSALSWPNLVQTSLHHLLSSPVNNYPFLQKKAFFYQKSRLDISIQHGHWLDTRFWFWAGEPMLCLRFGGPRPRGPRLGLMAPGHQSIDSQFS